MKQKIIDYIKSNIVVILLSSFIVIIIIIWFIVTNITNNNITKLNNVIEQDKITIAILTYDNKLTTVKIDSLKRVTLNYKDSVYVYKTKLKKLQIDYTKRYHEVNILNNSDSYKFFFEYIRNYTK